MDFNFEKIKKNENEKSLDAVSNEKKEEIKNTEETKKASVKKKRKVVKENKLKKVIDTYLKSINSSYDKWIEEKQQELLLEMVDKGYLVVDEKLFKQQEIEF